MTTFDRENADGRDRPSRRAEEQAALLRVATMVAEDPMSDELFSAVAREVAGALDVGGVIVDRFEQDGARVTVGSAHAVPGAGSGCAAAITVDGRRWGQIRVFARDGTVLPAGTEDRLHAFARLVATAIANHETRIRLRRLADELAASRGRIAAAADDERRRVVRDLHDGAQQFLVHTVISLKLARDAVQDGAPNGPALVERALESAQRATSELRELAHGILPSVLVVGGLGAGIDALCSRTAVPCAVDVSVQRLPDPIEAAAYFVVAEALTNVVKHASAQRVDISARIEDGTLRVAVRDDGVGGAVAAGGSGLLGLADRLAVLDGGLEVESPPGGGTLLTAAIPLTRGTPAP